MTQNYTIMFFVFQMVFLVASLLIALSVNDLGVVLSIVGATGSTVVSYILPGVFYYNMFGGKPTRNIDNTSTHSNSSSHVGHSSGSHRNHNDNDGINIISSSSGVIGVITTESPESSGQNPDREDVDSDEDTTHEHLDGKHAAWKLVLAKVQLIAGLVIMPVCLIAIFLK
jgi:Transmembrane amino acid transporter protein